MFDCGDLLWTPNRFSLFIETRAKKDGLGILESIAVFCEEREIDVYDVLPLLNDSIKEKIKQEQLSLGTIKEDDSKCKLPV